jgi:TonB family protein
MNLMLRHRMVTVVLGVTAALFVTIALIMQLFDPPQRIEDAVYEHLTGEVKVVDLDADPALRQAFEDSLHPKAEVRVAPEPPPKAPPPMPPREVRGFVQLEVTLDERGRVTAARVVGAMPPGRYEQQALADVRARSYPPIMVDGKAVPGKFAEVVNFQVAAEPAKAKGQ